MRGILPYLSEADVAAVLEWDPLMAVLEKAMVAFSAGKVIQPVRQTVPIPGRDAIIAAMPAVGESVAVKDWIGPPGTYSMGTIESVAGHTVHSDDPEALNTAVLRFLQSA